MTLMSPGEVTMRTVASLGAVIAIVARMPSRSPSQSARCSEPG